MEVVGASRTPEEPTTVRPRQEGANELRTRAKWQVLPADKKQNNDQYQKKLPDNTCNLKFQISQYAPSNMQRRCQLHFWIREYAAVSLAKQNI